MKLIFAISFFFSIQFSFGQITDSAFYIISKQVEKYKIDTTSPPNDKITKIIVELRALKGGFNINEAINFKLEEDLQKNEISKNQYDLLKKYFDNEGKQSLNNAIIWIYRNTFKKKELKQLVRFYKTDAGKKFSSVFPIIMLQSLMAAQIVKSQLNLSPK